MADGLESDGRNHFQRLSRCHLCRSLGSGRRRWSIGLCFCRAGEGRNRARWRARAEGAHGNSVWGGERLAKSLADGEEVDRCEIGGEVLYGTERREEKGEVPGS